MIKTFRTLTIIFILLGIIAVLTGHGKTANGLLLTGLLFGLANVFQEKNKLITKYHGADLTEIPENKPFVVLVQKPLNSGKFLKLAFFDPLEDRNFKIKERFILFDENIEITELPKDRIIEAIKRQRPRPIEGREKGTRAETIYYVIFPEKKAD